MIDLPLEIANNHADPAILTASWVNCAALIKVNEIKFPPLFFILGRRPREAGFGFMGASQFLTFIETPMRGSEALDLGNVEVL